MPDQNIVQDLRDAHAKLRQREEELLAIRSQLGPAKKRIAAARVALDTIITELASGQSSLPLFREPESNGPPPEPTAADREPIREAPLQFASSRRKRGKERAS